MDNPIPPGYTQKSPPGPPMMESLYQYPDGSVCWSAVTDVVWHMEKGQAVIDSQRILGSGRVLLPLLAWNPTDRQRLEHNELMWRSVTHMQNLAFMGALGQVGPMTQSILDIGLDGLDARYCMNCGGLGNARYYPGRWEVNLHQCLMCMKPSTCNMACSPSVGHSCPPPCR
jgi:hypothetical protein